MADFAELWVALTLLLPGESPRLLEPEAQQSLARKVDQACNTAKRENADGFELSWGDPPSAAKIGAMPAASEGKQFYIGWLKDRYGYQISKLNAAYGLESTSFSDLESMDFKQVDRRRQAVVEDDQRFLNDLKAMFEQKMKQKFQACAPGRKLVWK